MSVIRMASIIRHAHPGYVWRRGIDLMYPLGGVPTDLERLCSMVSLSIPTNVELLVAIGVAVR